jgi:hypothetical protein
MKGLIQAIAMHQQLPVVALHRQLDRQIEIDREKDEPKETI